MIEQASLVIGEGNWAVKSDSLLGYKINGGKYYPREMSVVRATTGTRINEDGLVELVPYNLLQRSEEFENVYWSKNNGAIEVNNTTAPDGKTTADKFKANTGTAFHYVSLGTPITVSSTHTFSFYVKKSTATWIFFTFRDNAINYFNLDTGVFGTTPDTCTSESVGNGWYRITVTKNTTPANCGIGIAGFNGGAQFVANGTEAIFIWGAQLVEGTSALTYQKTETRLNIPRIDSSLGGCPSILLEPQRTNIVTYSEQFDDVSWGKVNGGVGLVPTVTANTAISPSGAQNADRIQLSLNGGTTLADLSYINKAVSSTSAATFSIYAKSNTTPCTIYFRSGTVATAINITTEWQRFDFYNSGAITVVQLGLRGDSYGGAVNSNTADISVWGAQLEVGSYPTSYIPTQSATVTRNADVISKTGIADLFGSSATTIYIDFVKNENATGWTITGSNGTKLFSLCQFDSIAGIPRIVFEDGVDTINTLSALSNGRHKIAVSYATNNTRIYIDGTLILTDTSCTYYQMDRIGINSTAWSGFTNNTNAFKLNTAAIWPTALTSAELATLTTI